MNTNDSPILSFKDVSHEVDGDRLENFSFNLYHGQNVVFFGPEKCGKDLILPLATGKMHPKSGSVFFLSTDISKLSQTELYTLRKNFGYLLQNYGLINNLSVEANILLPLRYHEVKDEDEVKNTLNELLSFYHLKEKKDLRPFSLTESEKLRTSFLRALIINPRMIFIDSIENGQDPLKLSQFLDLAKIYFAAHDTAYLVTTYHVEIFVNHVNDFCLLYEGKIVFHGNGDITESPENPYLKQYLARCANGPIN
jgi:phospholipid/cholesterol/gamma-HCH transport system ATP-binding protein